MGLGSPALTALGAIGGNLAITALIELLRHDETIASYAIEPLVKIGAPAIPSLLVVLADHNNFGCQRAYAAVALGRIGGDDTVVSALIAALTDENEYIRGSTCVALEALGKPAVAAVPSLIEALTDHDSLVREHAAKALAEICGRPQEWVSLSSGGSKNIAQDLSESGRSAATAAVPALIAALVDCEKQVGFAAAEAITKIGERAITALKTARQDGNINIRIQVIKLLAKIIPNIIADDMATHATIGIERMANVYVVLPKLKVFYSLGLICFQDEEKRCTRTEVAKRADLSGPTVKEYIVAVTNFFREYFEQYGHLPQRGPFEVAREDDELASEEDKIIEREERVGRASGN